MIEILKEADIFACRALSAYCHKSSLLDSGEGRFKNDQTFMDAADELQSKLSRDSTTLNANGAMACLVSTKKTARLLTKLRLRNFLRGKLDE